MYTCKICLSEKSKFEMKFDKRFPNCIGNTCMTCIESNLEKVRERMLERKRIDTKLRFKLKQDKKKELLTRFTEIYFCNICNKYNPKSKIITTGKLAFTQCKPCGKHIAKLNKDKWFSENKDRVSEQARKRYIANKSHYIKVNNIRKNQWRAENPEIYRSKTREYYLKNKDKINSRGRDWNKNKRDLKNSLTAKRRASKKKATPKWLTAEHFSQILSFYTQAKLLQKETGVKYEVDHICPLQSDLVCGLHVPWNLQVIPKIENNQKSNKLVEDLLCQIS